MADGSLDWTDFSSDESDFNIGDATSLEDVALPDAPLDTSGSDPANDTGVLDGVIADNNTAVADMYGQSILDDLTGQQQSITDVLDELLGIDGGNSTGSSKTSTAGKTGGLPGIPFSFGSAPKPAANGKPLVAPPSGTAVASNQPVNQLVKNPSIIGANGVISPTVIYMVIGLVIVLLITFVLTRRRE